jgi:hypothetical protein
VALHDNGKSGGKSGGGWFEAVAVEAEILVADLDIKNVVNQLLLHPQPPAANAAPLTGFWRMLGLVWPANFRNLVSQPPAR